MVNFKPPHQPITFEAYANDVILPYIKSQANNCSRVDIIFDVYLENSLKSQTKKERGTGIRRKVVGSGMTPKSWSNFLRVSENKTKLFSFLAERIASLNPSKLVCVTQGENVLCNKNIDLSGICPCNHEEADTRLFVHVKHTAIQGLKTSLVVITNTDVVVLAISMFAKLDKLWIAFGKGKDLRWIPIHEISNALGPRALCLPFVHAFTSCDTVSAFRGKGKRTAWQVWEIFDDATDTFFRLSQTPAVIDDQDMEFIEAFVVIMYDRTTTTFPVNKARLEMLARKQRQYDAIPPTRAALLEHTKREAYQGGNVWGQSLNFSQDLPSPEDWGWKIGTEECYWTPNWTTLPAIAASCQELLKCGCKKGSCSGRCKCYNAGLSCTALCSCNC
jgi:hypothetical protein